MFIGSAAHFIGCCCSLSLLASAAPRRARPLAYQSIPSRRLSLKYISVSLSEWTSAIGWNSVQQRSWRQ
jgi:hypothetical protein